METALGSIDDEWIKKCMHNAILFSHNKRGNPDICDNMDEP